MKNKYINIITNNSIGVLISIQNKFSVSSFSSALCDKGFNHLLVGLKLEDDNDFDKVVSDINDIDDVEKVFDLSDCKKQIKYVFNINGNCKKTLKKISIEPDKIIETDKEWVYIFILKRKEIELFTSELNNLRLSYTYRVIGLT